MTDYLTNSEIDTFLKKLGELPLATRIDFRRHCGEQYSHAPTELKLSLLACLPADNCSELLLQNSYFVACVFGDNGTSEKHCEDLAASTAFKLDRKRSIGLTDYSNSRIEPLLSSHAGMSGNFYTVLGNILYGSKESVDCKQLMIDIQNWDNPKDNVKRRWARAYLKKTSSNKEGEESHD